MAPSSPTAASSTLPAHKKVWLTVCRSPPVIPADARALSYLYLVEEHIKSRLKWKLKKKKNHGGSNMCLSANEKLCPEIWNKKRGRKKRLEVILVICSYWGDFQSCVRSGQLAQTSSHNLNKVLISDDASFTTSDATSSCNCPHKKNRFVSFRLSHLRPANQTVQPGSHVSG